MFPKHVKAPKKGPVILDEYKRYVFIEGWAKLKSNVRHMISFVLARDCETISVVSEF